jgi:hypothetical protein
MVGIFTFGMAVAEGGMPIVGSFKILVASYLGVYLMQSLSMLISSDYYLIIVNIFDGWIKGGIMLLGIELSAELGFPYAESLSLGFMLAIESLIKWPFAMLLGILNFSENPDAETEKENVKPLFIFAMILYLLCNVVSVHLLR